MGFFEGELELADKSIPSFLGVSFSPLLFGDFKKKIFFIEDCYCFKLL